MKFLITRTSNTPFIEEKRMRQPHDKAYVGKYLEIDMWSVDAMQKINNKRERDSWHDKGLNHRIEDGWAKRDIEKDGWFINLGSLDELLELVKEEEIVVSRPNRTKYFEIEIYDDYRE